MNLTCPYCLSDDVIQVVNQHVSNTESSGLSSVELASLGVSLSKTFSSSVSPVIGGIAGVVLGGLFNSVFDEPKKPVFLTYYHCHHCQQNFR